MMRFTTVFLSVVLVMIGCDGDHSAMSPSPDGGTAGDGASDGDSAIWPDGGTADDGASDGATVSVVVSPAAVALAPAEQQQFTATVTGDANKAVTWSIVEAAGCGQITNGLYTAPGSSGTCHVRATSVADPTKSDTATVTVEVITTDAIVLAPDGDDSLGDGTVAKPWHTLAKAWTAVTAGKTVYLRGGTYNWSAKQSLSGKNGTAGNMIRVERYPGEYPNITVTPTFDYGSWPGAVIYFQGDYVHWKGLEISNAAQRPDGTGGHGMYVMNAENNVFENLHVHHNALGFKMDGRYYGQTTGNLVLNSDFHHNGDPYTPGDPYGNGDGLELGYNTTGESNTVRGCRSWSNSDDGYDLWSNDGTVVIDNCWAWKNGFIPGTSTKGGDGHGFKFGKSDDDHASAIVTATQCVSAENRLSGFHQNGMQAPVVLYNNAAHHNGGQGYWFGEAAKAHKLTNNIAFDNGGGASVLTSQSTVTTCTFTQSGANNASFPVAAGTFVSLDYTQLESPRKPDGSLPDIDYLHLQASSPLVDSGTAVGLPHAGAGPDLGPFDR